MRAKDNLFNPWNPFMTTSKAFKMRYLHTVSSFNLLYHRIPYRENNVKEKKKSPQQISLLRATERRGGLIRPVARKAKNIVITILLWAITPHNFLPLFHQSTSERSCCQVKSF